MMTSGVHRTGPCSIELKPARLRERCRTRHSRPPRQGFALSPTRAVATSMAPGTVHSPPWLATFPQAIQMFHKQLTRFLFSLLSNWVVTFLLPKAKWNDSATGRPKSGRALVVTQVCRRVGAIARPLASTRSLEYMLGRVGKYRTDILSAPQHLWRRPTTCTGNLGGPRPHRAIGPRCPRSGPAPGGTLPRGMSRVEPQSSILNLRPRGSSYPRATLELPWSYPSRGDISQYYAPWCLARTVALQFIEAQPHNLTYTCASFE